MFEDAKALIKGGTAAGKVAAKLFPGIAERSHDNAASHSVRSAMSDIDAIRTWSSEKGMPDSVQASLINLAFEKRDSDQRVEDCFRFAAPQIKEDAEAENLDEEWLDYWRMHAEKVRADDVRAIWGAILAGEVNSPGAVSKRTMSVLADMGRQEAQTFGLLCSRCIRFNDSGRPGAVTPFLIEPGEAFAIDPADLALLKDLGLIDFSVGMGMKVGRNTRFESPEVIWAGRIPLIVFGGEDACEVNFFRYPFAAQGLELAKYCGIGNGEGFVERLVVELKVRKLKVGIVDHFDGDTARYHLL